MLKQRVERPLTTLVPIPCYRVDGQDAKEQPEVTASLSPSYRANLGDTGLRWNLRADFRFETGQWRESANIAKTADLLTSECVCRSEWR